MTALVHIFELAHNWRNWRKSLGAVKPRALALRQCASAPVPLGMAHWTGAATPRFFVEL
jgi:hypothetical protein